MKPLDELVLPVIKRTSGIILKHKETPDITFQICLKDEQNVPILNKMIRPIFPDCKKFRLLFFFSPSWLFSVEVPDVRSLLTGEISDEKRFEIIIWALDLDLEEDQLKSIPPDYFFIILSLVYLNQNDSMTKAEALGCLKTLIQEKNQPIPEIPRIS
jgi:hypothetical protein